MRKVDAADARSRPHGERLRDLHAGRLVIKLAKNSQLFPPGLYFHCLTALQPDPVSGGAHADIYLAEDCSGRPVAVKRLRAFQASASSDLSKNRQVRSGFFCWRYDPTQYYVETMARGHCVEAIAPSSHSTLSGNQRRHSRSTCLHGVAVDETWKYHSARIF